MTTLFMRARRSGWLRIGTLTLVAVALAVPLAASASSNTTAGQSKAQAAFKKDFLSYLTEMQQVAAILQANQQGRAAAVRLGIKPKVSLARSRESVERMTPVQLAALQQAFATVPNWRAHPRVLTAALRRNGLTRNGGVRAFAVGPDCDPGPGTPLGITDWYIAVGVALALEIAHEAIPDDIVTSPLQIAAAGLWGVAATAALVLESLTGRERVQRREARGLHENAAGRRGLDPGDETSVNAVTTTLNSLSTLVNSRLDVAVSTRATELSLDAFHSAFTANATTVNTKLDGITSSLASAHTKLDSLTITVNDQGALALRLQIEADLSEPGNHPVALFEVPASGGGYLDLTREIVVDTIAKMQAAGQGVGNAQAFLAAGDAARAAQDYKDAYADYGKAYRAAAT